MKLTFNYYTRSQSTSNYSVEVMAARMQSRSALSSPKLLFPVHCNLNSSILGPPPLTYSSNILNYFSVNHRVTTAPRSIQRNNSQAKSIHPVPTDYVILNPRTSFNLSSFNVRTLMQIGQQAALAHTLESLNIDICCLSETRLHDASTIVRLSSPNINSTTTYSLRVSGDESNATAGQAGVGIALSAKAESALSDWFPVNGRLCAARFNGVFRVSKTRENRTLFVVSAYAPTNCSSEASKDDFYHQLQDLLQKTRGSDIVVLAGDMNAQVGRLTSDESNLGGQHSVSNLRNDNGERLLQLLSLIHI
jgi:exonuclease III